MEKTVGHRKYFGIMHGATMKHLSLTSLIIGVLASLGMLFGTGSGHALLTQSSPSHGMDGGESSKQCQSICPPVLSEKQRNPTIQEDDTDPNPLPFWSLPLPRHTSLIYAVAMIALALAFLRRRPPDLVAIYGNWRN
ncbi:hypothetical protein H0X10_00160 [Candidatus Saccharibacteria bacterium]|nr:hypothetical protein [Candidatus Saccharibacteria bacterium]